MGNKVSTLSLDNNNVNVKFINTIEHIAANLILTQNFQDMKKLANMDYCNNLVILTSNILQGELNEMEIDYLAQRLKGNVEINEMKRTRVLILNKNKLYNKDVKNATEKKRMCIGIASFYIKISHLFASILTTINPTYTFIDSDGKKKYLSLLEKINLPSNIITNLESLNLCSNRINILKGKNNYNIDSDNENVYVKPDFCKMNVDNLRFDGTKRFISEIGIPELEQLYFDKYNYNEGRFGGKQNIEDNMMPETYKQYKEDLLLFYKTFTGNNELPLVDKLLDGKMVKVPAITKFSQIPLRSYHKNKGCEVDGIFQKEYKGSFREKLFYDYAQHIKKMVENVEKVQMNLLSIIDDLFVYDLKNDNIPLINPSLTVEKLQSLIVRARGIIVGLYLSCENDFIKGLNIFNAITELQKKNTALNQIRELESMLYKSIAESSIDIDVPVSHNEILNDYNKNK